MNWYKLLMVVLIVLVAFTALLMGACAYAAEQHGNMSDMYTMMTCVGLCMVILVGLFREAVDE